MPGKAPKVPVETITTLAIRIDRHEARFDASVNHNAYAPEHAFRLDEKDPVYCFNASLVVSGTVSDPTHRRGDQYELVFHGDDSPSISHNLTLKDIHERDEHHSLKYRLYRGSQIPIYAAPKGLGHLQKMRGENRWTAWIFVPNRFVSDMLTLLGHGRTLFLVLHERKVGRTRWIASTCLQTTDPANE